MLLGGGAASALAGPGAILKQQGADPQPVPGSAIAANANTGGTYTHREAPGERGRPITLRGLSISGLLSLGGFNPRAVSNISVVGGDGPLITLTGPEINNPPFPQGPALVSDSGGTTTFFKPARNGAGQSFLVRSVPGTPLEIQVDGGSLLSVEVTATPTTAKVGQPVTLRARVRFAPPGASLTFTWNFDDGSPSESGQTVTHAFKYSSDFEPLVQVEGSGGSQCSPSCGGPGKVRVQITGETREPDQTPGTPNGGGTGGTGSGGSGTGAGSGDGTSGAAGSGSQSGSAARKPPALRPERPEADERFSSDPTSGAGKTIVQGILLAGSGSTIEGGLPGGASAGSPKPATGVTGTAEDPSTILISVALALAFVLLGALRERRNVRLRVA